MNFLRDKEGFLLLISKTSCFQTASSEILWKDKKEPAFD